MGGDPVGGLIPYGMGLNLSRHQIQDGLIVQKLIHMPNVFATYAFQSCVGGSDTLGERSFQREGLFQWWSLMFSLRQMA